MLQVPYKLEPRFNFHRQYRNALYQTLIALKPKYCLEIGTNHGATAEVFQTYFDKYMSDGACITTDIKIYRDLNLKNVHQVQVHSWIDNPWDHHHGKDSELRAKDGNTNYKIIMEAMLEYDIPWFDFMFIDGDHTEPSVRADFELFYELPTSPQSVVLLDDTDEDKHYCSHLYKNEIKKNSKFSTYDYENWPCRVGMALIWITP